MSNSSNSSNHSGGIGFCGLLGIVFIVLKLTHVIDWSWWWVTAPIWGPTVLVITGLVVFLIAKLIIKVVKH